MHVNGADSNYLKSIVYEQNVNGVASFSTDTVRALIVAGAASSRMLGPVHRRPISRTLLMAGRMVAR